MEDLEYQAKEFGLFFFFFHDYYLEIGVFIKINLVAIVDEIAQKINKWKKMEKATNSEVVVVETLGHKDIICRIDRSR